MSRPRLSPTTPAGTPAGGAAGTGRHVARTALIVALALVVIGTGVVLAVPQWRAAVLTSSTVTMTASPPAEWRPPATAPPPRLPFEQLAPVPAPAGAALAERMPSLARAAATRQGVVVIDPDTGRALIRRADRPLIPASTMKLLTCIAALDSLGSNRTFTTAVVSPEPGVIVLRGGGDPLLRDARTTGRASLQELAARTAVSLKQAGIGSVTLGYDDTLFTGRSWHPRWTDNYRYSVAPITALMVDGGRTDTGEAQSDPARSAARTFAKRLARAGVRVSSPKPVSASTSAEVVASMQSATVEQLIEHTLRYSDNTAAETLARQVGLAEQKGGSFAGARAGVRASLKRLGLWADGMVLDDDSGLSRSNRVAPGTLAHAMRLVLTQERFRSLAVGLPVGGVSGTLLDRFDDRAERTGRGKVRAKTGSLRDVSTLAGYVVTADGALIVFAIMTNGVIRPDTVKDWIDRTTAGWAACGCG